MDKEKFEEMMEKMRDCCQGEGNKVDCCPMMKKMMRYNKGAETQKKKKDTEEAE